MSASAGCGGIPAVARGCLIRQDETFHPNVANWRSLQDIPENDHDLDGWRLAFAAGISHDGTVIVGTGYNPDGVLEGYRVELPRRDDFIFADRFEGRVE